MCSFSKYKIIFFVFLFGFFQFTFSNGKPIFKDIRYIYGSKNKKICKTFNKNYKKNLFTSQQKSLIVLLISDLDSRDLKSYDAYLNFFSFSNSLVNKKSNFLKNWLQSLSNCSSSLSDVEIEGILSSSNNFIQNSILSENEKFKWSYAGDFSSYEADTLTFQLKLDALVLSNQFHEIVINDVEGFFDLRKNKLFAKSGYVDGARFGFDSSFLKVKFSEYEIDLNSRIIEVNNAVLNNNKYFNLEFKGHFSDYLSRIPRRGDFPKFQSYKDDLEINFFNGFSCSGAVNIERDVFFIKKFNENLNFYFKNNHIEAVFSSDLLKLNNSSFSSNKVLTKIYFNNGDSIFHPEMKFRFDDLDKNIYLRNYDFSHLGYKPILNSFHGLNIYSDFLRVNLDKNTAAFVHYPSKVEQNVLFESVDYYDDKRFNDLNIDDKNNLLSILIKFSNDFNLRNNIPVEVFSEDLGLNISQANSILNTLEIFDFVSFDSYLNEFDIKKRAFSFFDSKKRKFDFDSFQIESSCFLDDTVSLLDFSNLKMDIFNVTDIKITNQHDYFIDLKSKKISFFEDRSFFMNANLRFGNFLFSSKDIEFNYDDFCFYFPEKSSCDIFNLKSFNKDKLINKLIFRGGKIQIDSLNNKSGVSTIYDFPKFYIPKDNFVEFENQDPKLVLYENVIPFLDEIAIQNLSFDGYLNMNKVGQFMKGQVGFDPLSGFNFRGKLDNKELYKEFICSGSFLINKNNFIVESADVINSNLSFFADTIFVNSKFSYSNSVFLKGLKSGLKSPSCSFSYNYSDSTMLFSSKQEDFSFYDFYFSGILNYDFSDKVKKVFGKGSLAGSYFNIDSDYFSFNNNSFMSGNSSVSIRKNTLNKFLSKGVSVEWVKNDDFISIIKGDVDFFLPSINVYLNFDFTSLNLNEGNLTFSNLDDVKKTNLLLNNYLDCFISEFYFNFHTEESSFIWLDPFYLDKFFITPKNKFLEINSSGLLKPFKAKFISKKKFGQDEFFENKLVTYDREKSTFLVQ